MRSPSPARDRDSRRARRTYGTPEIGDRLRVLVLAQDAQLECLQTAVQKEASVRVQRAAIDHDLSSDRLDTFCRAGEGPRDEVAVAG